MDSAGFVLMEVIHDSCDTKTLKRMKESLYFPSKLVKTQLPSAN